MDPAAPCPVALPRSVAAIRAEATALEPVLAATETQRWNAPTRLPAWNVHELAAHLARGVGRITAYLAAPVPPTPEVDWLGYWRSVAEADPAAVARRSVREAQRRPPGELTRSWARSCEDAAVESEAAGSDRVLLVPAGAMRLDHYLTTRVLELVVHGLDLRHALDLEQVATPTALEIAATVLDGLLSVPRPVDLERDDVAFVLAATGREPHDDPDLPVLT